jgi:hypothetical protein
LNQESIMADINLTCLKCGITIAVSEYANGRVPCPHCGTMLDKTPSKLGVLRPQLAHPDGRSVLATPAPTKLSPAPRHDSNQRARAALGPRLWLRVLLAWILFFGLLGALLAWQWKGQQDARYLQTYLNVRWWLFAAAWLAILVPAFLDSWLQGVLCLCVPPYTLYYGLDRLDYFIVRAFYFAVVFALGAEFYFLPGITLVGIVQTEVNDWIVSVRRLIEDAGRHVDTL